MTYTFLKKIAGLSLVLSFIFSVSFGQLTITDTANTCSSHVLRAQITGTLPTGTGLTGDDDYSGLFPIGFTFNFYGTNYTQLVIGSNGVLNFNAALAGAYCPWSITGQLLGNANMRNAICGPWCDILIGAGGSITRTSTGVAPNRKFAVTWCGTRMYSCTAEWTTTQIIIYETSNIIEVHTAHKTACAWNSGRAITGVQNAAGTVATVAPGRDWNPSWTVIAPPEAWRFTPSGATYTVASITYAPMPYATSGIYWYNATTGAYLGSGPYLPVNPTVPTTYMAAALGCNDSTKAYYTVVPFGCLAVQSNAPCVGDTLWLNASGDSTGATYEWQGPAPYTGPVLSTAQKFFRFPATAAMSGTYRVIKIVGGMRDTAYGTVNVYRPPVVTATSSMGLCAPITSTVNLFCNTDSVCSAWSWTGPAGFSSGLQNPIINPFDITKEGVYSVTATSTHGCKGSGSVLVKPGPAPIIGPSQVCQYFSITLSDATPGGVWSSSNPAIASITTGGVVSGLTPGTVTISYSMPNGCGTATTVTVNGKPLPPIVPEVRPCQFTVQGALSVTVTGPGYTTTWYGPGVTPPMPFGSGNSTIVPATDVPGITEYWVTQTSPFGCVSDSVRFPVRIVPEPARPATQDSSYCQHDPLVAPVVAFGDSLRWYTTSTAPGFSGSFIAPTPSVTNPGVTTYYVTQQQLGCESPKAALTVTVLYKPEFKITATKDWVCQYDSLVLGNTAPAGMVDPGFIWQLPIGAAFVNGTNAGVPSVEVRFDTVWGRHDVYLTISTYKGRCSTTEFIPIKVIPAPDARLYINPDVCLGDTVSLALNSHSANSHTYTWIMDGAPMLSSPDINIVTANVNSGGPYLVSFNKVGLHIFNITGITKEGCTAQPRGDTVKVHALPDPRFTVSQIPNKLCVEDSVLFTANVKDYGYNYKWEPEHSFANQNKPELWGKVELTRSRISLTVTDAFGCDATYTKQINPDECCSVTMPNAFTPNGDGRNDRYRPIFDGYRRFHVFRVTNRWGQTVFESGNSDPSWDGTYNGVPQDMGTYFFYLKYDCGGKALETKGDVMLIR
ncbi:hypothetical protein GCM10023093_20950 [Nemorincola caseinilytica]|uniref:Gliding motility-associated C-terminal domain-containing protein n=1 Tax=Nemorincola caseinilytica TaxID=2054315 RepID=A0ABP8NIY0_9BACT